MISLVVSHNAPPPNHDRDSWTKAARPQDGPFDAWMSNTWFGILVGSPNTSHEDLYQNGDAKLPPGSYVPAYAERGNRQALCMTMFKAFEQACYDEYQTMLPVFHLAATTERSAEALDDVPRAPGMQQEEANIMADYKAGQKREAVEEDEEGNLDGYYDAEADDCYSDLDGMDAVGGRDNSSIHGSPMSPCSPVHSPRSPLSPSNKEGTQARVSPAAGRKNRRSLLLMLSAHGTTKPELQTEQTIYFVTGAGLYESLALMKQDLKTAGPKLSQQERDKRDIKLRASLSFVTTGSGSGRGSGGNVGGSGGGSGPVFSLLYRNIVYFIRCITLFCSLAVSHLS